MILVLLLMSSQWGSTNPLSKHLIKLYFWAEIHQALLSQLSHLVEFFIGQVLIVVAVACRRGLAHVRSGGQKDVSSLEWTTLKKACNFYLGFTGKQH